MGPKQFSACRRGLLISGAVAVLALPASAAAQATRTWVSGTGDDANPCSRTAPCKTWAGAISKTAPGGEIDALDDGGFGALTITKAITINGGGHVAGVLVAGTNGFVVQAAATDVVTLEGLDINGLGPGQNSLNGVKVNTAGVVHLTNDDIYGFGDTNGTDGDGVLFAPTNNNASLTIDHTRIHDNANDGVAAVTLSGYTARVNVTNSTIENNACGLVAGGSSACTTTGGTSAGTESLTSSNSSITGNSTAGVLSDGSGATNNLVSDLIDGNGQGLLTLNGGQIVEYGSNNQVFGNTTDGAPTAKSNALVGPQGPPGANGTNGVNGKNGLNGTNGALELITCKRVTKTVTKTVHGKRRKVKRSYEKCTGKLLSGTVKFNAAARDLAPASISSGRSTVASGIEITSRHEGIFRVTKRLKGRYTLISRHGRRTSTQTIVVS